MMVSIQDWLQDVDHQSPPPSPPPPSPSRSDASPSLHTLSSKEPSVDTGEETHYVSLSLQVKPNQLILLPWAQEDSATSSTNAPSSQSSLVQPAVDHMKVITILERQIIVVENAYHQMTLAADGYLSVQDELQHCHDEMQQVCPASESFSGQSNSLPGMFQFPCSAVPRKLSSDKGQSENREFSVRDGIGSQV